MKIVLFIFVLMWTSNGFSGDYGSQKILSSCFTDQELSGHAKDLLVSPRHAPDKSMPSQTQLQNPLPSLEGEAKVIRSVKTGQEKLVALTFDMCELTTKRAGYDYQAVNALRKYDASATFFLSGKWMKTHPVKAKQLIADPLFEIGNHAWTHGNFGVMSEVSMRKQVEWTQAQYETLRDELISSKCCENLLKEGEQIPLTIKLFRFPYGRCRLISRELVHSYGLQMIQWNVVDGRNKEKRSANYYADDLMKRIQPGSIVLLHANGVIKQTGEVVEAVVKRLVEDGYKMLTVSDLLARGAPDLESECYFHKVGDSLSLDEKYGDGTEHPSKN